MKATMLCLMLLAASGAQAQTRIWWTSAVCWFDGKRINPKVLARQVEALGYDVEIVSCGGSRCRVSISTDVNLTQQQKDEIEQAITDHTYRDFKMRRANLEATAQALKDKATKTPLERLVLYLLRREGLGE